MDGWINEQVVRWTDGWLHGGQMYRWLDRQIRQMSVTDGWMDEWIHEAIKPSKSSFISVAKQKTETDIETEEDIYFGLNNTFFFLHLLFVSSAVILEIFVYINHSSQNLFSLSTSKRRKRRREKNCPMQYIYGGYLLLLKGYFFARRSSLM